MWTTVLLISSVLGTVCYGLPLFRDLIPNGHMVPDPCSPGRNITWQGVGHDVSPGGGNRNQFGMDFKSQLFRWDEELCKKDSDGDGKTNGQELGDPNCVWKRGNPAPANAIGHPGICEPMNNTACEQRNTKIKCPNAIYN